MTFGLGDTVAIAVAIVFLLVGMINPFNRDLDRIVVVLANGLSFGNLILIVISPFAQIFKLAGPNLFELAVKEGKVSLWWGAVVACFNLIRVWLEKPKPPQTGDATAGPPAA